MRGVKGSRAYLNPMYAKFARRLEAIIRSQSPVDTGALKASVQVRFVKGVLEIYLPSETKYGTYLHTGTGKQTAAGSSKDFADAYYNLRNNKWNPVPGKGTEGIKPRSWMNVSETQYDSFGDELATEFAKQETKIIVALLQKDFA
jgi:hypothetical protein